MKELFKFLVIFIVIFLPKNAVAFSEETVDFEVSEDVEIGKVIGKLEKIDGFTYRLSRGNSKIHFDPETLEISTSSKLDHESEDLIDMLIITSPPSIIHLMIKVLDVNDNDPRFLNDVQQISIPETAPIGWRVSLSGAIDPDTNRTISNYDLLGEEEEKETKIFGLYQSDGLIYLEVIEKLDRELKNEYEMRLIAKDDGIPSRNSSCLLHIQILDTNDNFPDFGIRSIDIKYNPRTDGNKIFRLNATDADEAENGRITYKLVENDDIFEISQDNTYLLLKNNTKLEEETKNTRDNEKKKKVTIEASDHGTPPLVSFLDIWIQVVDNLEGKNNRNMNEPNINIRFYPADHDYIVVQPEDVNGKTLAILSITDPDGPIGPNSTIKIVKGNEDSIFALISRSNINILTLRNIEKAEKSRYEIVFEANDDQLPNERKTRKSLKIYVKKNMKTEVKIDVPSKINVEIPKNIAIGSYVTHINNNCSNECYFELEDNSNSFVIDRSSGVVTTSRISIENVEFIVRTFLPPPREDYLETLVTVRILKTTKTSRIHLRRTYQFSIWDNSTVGSVVGTLPKANIFSTFAGSSIIGVFPDGSIYLAQPIPENSRILSLEVVLKQNNATQLTTVTVIVRKNKNNGNFSCQPTSFSIKENEKPGSIIGSFDVEQIGFYDLLDSEDLLFISGANLISRVSFDAEQSTLLNFKYRLTSIDGKFVNCNASLEIEDVNDNAPIFDRYFYETTISTEGVIDLNISTIDLDISSEHRNVEYRLLNYIDMFSIDRKNGKINTTANFPFSRLNLSIEAVNDRLTTKSFVLITSVINQSKFVLKSEKILKIYGNDVPGNVIYKLEIGEANDFVDWKFEESEKRFSIDSNGNVRLLEFSPEENRTWTILKLNSIDYKFDVEYILDEDRNEHANSVEDLEFIDKIDIGEDSKVVRTIPEIQYFTKNGSLFLVENELAQKQDVFVFMEGPTRNRTFHLHSHSSFTSQSCQSKIMLISNPGKIYSNCSTDFKLLTSVSNVLPNLTITNIEESVQTLDLVTSTGSPFMITLIQNKTSEDVKFSTNNILMLVSSSHSLNSSFGRVTAESNYRIRYYLVETSQVSIDPDTGELFLKERFYKTLNDIILVAVVPTGITRAKLTIEVIEDHLHIGKQNIVIFAPFQIQLNQPIGSIDISRNDLLIDIIDDYFYVRDNQLLIKKIPPTGRFYDLEGIAKKSKLSASFKVTVVFGDSRNANQNENDLKYEIEELLAAGSVIGSVPNPKTAKYRLIDMNCGLLIDQQGIIRSSQIFNRSETLNITTKMIDIGISKIWNIYVQIKEVNNNPPKIKNSPKKLFAGDRFELIVEDKDESDIFMEVIAGDPLNYIDFENGKIHVSQQIEIPFNVTLRISDQQPPFKYNFEDLSIEILPRFPQAPICANKTIGIFGKMPKIGDFIGKVDISNGRSGTFRILNSEEASHFSINNIGEIFVRKSMENIRETRRIKVEVRSYSGLQYSFCHVDINCDFVEEDIGLSKENLVFDVLETALPGTEIGKVQETPTNVIFEIENDDNFTISSFDGMLRVNSPLDFENIQQYKIVVKIYKFGQVFRKIVEINIINENDEIPRFITGDIVYLSMLEEQKAPLIIGSSIAEDLDDQIITYSIVSGTTSMFSVNSTTGQISCLQTVDREESSQFELEIEARDGKGNYATSKIVLNVEDVNDNSPIFDQNIYIVDVMENSQIGMKIMKIHAEDRDEEGENSRISYSIDDSVQFRIDEATGWISVVGKIDREIIQNQTITANIIATDHGKEPRSTKVPIIFNILDDNDNSPIILNSESDIYVSAEIRKGDIAFVIDVNDKDQDDLLKFNIISTDYEINKYGEVLFVKNGKNKIEVIVEDLAKHTTSKVFQLQKYPGKFPKFSKNLKKTWEISEGIRKTIGNFEVEKILINLTYQLVESNKCKGYFEISQNATLVSKEIVDRENVEKCDIWIVAKTRSRDRKELRSYLKLEIEIMDVNDNIPIFEKQLYRFEVRENGGEALKIGDVKAIDKDKNDRISYRIISGDIFHEFIINEFGSIEAIRDLDRETIEEYRLVIEASDSFHTSNTTVIIKLLDEDDNAPRFSRIFHAEIDENVEIGSFVVQISASDADLDENHHFFFEGADEIPFRIDEMTGMVYTKDILDYEKKSSYRIKVRLQDGVWSIETSLFITILNINDNPPIFEHNSYAFLVSHSEIIGKVLAKDLDSDSKIQYSIDDPNFDINSTSGEIRLCRNISTPVLEFIVSAYDSKFRSDSKVFAIFENMWNIEERFYNGSQNFVGLFEKNTSQILPDLSANPSIFYVLDEDRKHLLIYKSANRSSNFSKLEDLEIEIPSFTEIGDIIGKIETDVHFENSDDLPIEIDARGNIRLRKGEAGKVEMIYNDGIVPKTNQTMNILIKVISEDDEIIRKKNVLERKIKDIQIFDVSAYQNSTEISLSMINQPNCVVDHPQFSYSPAKLILAEKIKVGTYQLNIKCADQESLLDLTILPTYESRYPEVVYTNSHGFSMELAEIGETAKFYLADDNLRSIFELTENGHFKTKRELARGVYKVPIKIRNEKMIMRIIVGNSDTVNWTDIQLNSINPSKNSQISQADTKTTIERFEIEEPVEIEVICLKSSIANLIIDLRKKYDDMKINIISAFEITFDLRYRLIFSIIDRNGKVLDSSETRRTLRSYFERINKPSYIEVIGFSKDLCSDCKFGLDSTSRLQTRYKDQIFDIPTGKLVIKKKEDTEIQNLLHDSEENVCGSSGICQCSNGFESFKSCDNELVEFSAKSLKIIGKNYSRIEEMAERDCDGEQKIEVDFRTGVKGQKIFMIYDFAKQTAKIEIINGFLKFSLYENSNHFRKHIEVQLDRKINDGRWHRFRFSMKKKKMAIQIDGKGKELKSKINLPLLYTAKSINFGEFCYRRLIAQNILVYGSSNPLFDFDTSELSGTCSSDSQDPQKIFGTLTIIISISLFIILIMISGLIFCLVRKYQNNKTGWEEAKEIDAYRTKISGNINMAYF